MSVISLSVLFRLNKPLTIGASYIGMPPLIPFIIYFSHQVGAWVLGVPNNLLFAWKMDITVDFVWQNLLQQMVGGVIFAGVISTLIAGATFIALRLRKNKISA